MTSTSTTIGESVTTTRGAQIKKFVVGAGPLVALVALVVFFAIASPTFSQPGNLSILLTQLSILLVIGVGLTFVILLGSIDLSVEGVMASSSLVFVLFAANDRNDFEFGLLAVVAGILTGSLFGLVNGVLHVRLGIPSFMVTLGTGAIGIGLATVLFGGRAPRLLDEGLRAWGVGSTAGLSNLVFIAIVVLGLAFLVQRFTRVGRYGYVIGGDEPIAKLSGINIRKYKISSFVLSGTASGIAGVMAATQLGVGDTTIGTGFLFTAITAVVLGGTLLVGGRGGVIRTLIGVAIITVLANGLILVGVDPYIQTAVQGLVIVVAVIASGWSLRRRVRVIK
ncbi:ribose transport system permease protein [Conyzicola nivalis]|jgi:ribose transport system permease protein|uniref:Ribose transport system permease protein n=1 Tax=Conyzicola nivalis TaxID=1477021 RepID=A0ABV2QPC6_9MICO